MVFALAATTGMICAMVLVMPVSLIVYLAVAGPNDEHLTWTIAALTIVTVPWTLGKSVSHIPRLTSPDAMDDPRQHSAGH
jgi:hypothetical protein